MMGAMKSSLFWGRRGGSISKTGERVFRAKRKSVNRRENKGPSGRALRRRPEGKDIGRPRVYRCPRAERRALAAPVVRSRVPKRPDAGRPSKQGKQSGAK